jgi:hypothetical protein
MTEDPVRDGSNWFAYVNNDPVNYVDPWGLEIIKAGDIVALTTATQNFLKGVLESPESYDVMSYSRDAFIPIANGKTNSLTPHSFYTFTDTRETKDNTRTLSFNGTALVPNSTGVWQLDSPKDLSSYIGYLSSLNEGNKNTWDVAVTTPAGGIDPGKTAQNIIDNIASGKTYSVFDGLVYSEDKQNCNTALQDTIAGGKRGVRKDEIYDKNGGRSFFLCGFFFRMCKFK